MKKFRFITMRKGMGMLLAAFLVSHFSFLISCTSIDCPVQNTVESNYSLLKANGTADTLDADTMWLWTRRAATDRRDTMLNALTGTTTTFSLQISHTLPEDSIWLALVDKEGEAYLDTIVIKKENIPHFESVDCQASYFHTITSVEYTNDIIDSLVVNNPHVNYDYKTTHFKLYLKPRR